MKRGEKTADTGREARARARAVSTDDGTRTDEEVRKRAREYALDALEVLRDSLDSGDEKVAAAAARDLAYVWAKLPQVELPPEKPLTAEEREARLVGALEDPEVRAWLVKRGWRPPAPVAAGKEAAS